MSGECKDPSIIIITPRPTQILGSSACYGTDYESDRCLKIVCITWKYILTSNCDEIVWIKNSDLKF